MKVQLTKSANPRQNNFKEGNITGSHHYTGSKMFLSIGFDGKDLNLVITKEECAEIKRRIEDFFESTK